MEQKNKRGALGALLMMIMVLVVAAVGYHFLQPLLAGDPVDQLQVYDDSSQSSSSSQTDDAGQQGGQGAAGGQSSQDPAQSDLTPAPDFQVQDAAGNPVKLSEMAGKPVVLNFWASWCPPCRGEMPDFDKVYAELGDQVVFMMVDLTDGSRETVETGAKFIADQGYSFPVYYDVDYEAGTNYGITSIPQSFFINAQGEIVAMANQGIDEETLRYGISLIQ